MATTGCCGGGGRCFCSVIAGSGVVVTGTGSSNNPFVIAASGGGGGDTHYYYPEDYGAAAYPFDSGDALRDCYQAAHDAGGGTVVIWERLGFTGDVSILGGVNTLQLSIPQLEIPAEAEIGLIALDTTSRVLYGLGGTGGSTNDNPGVVYNLYVDGDNVSAGSLFLCNAANSTLFNLQVRNSAGNGLDLGPSQNLVFYNVQSGGHSSGIACDLKTTVLGQQGPGGNKFYGGHIGDSKTPLRVSASGPTDFFPPHDNIFDGVIFETGRTAGLPIDCSVKLEAGETQFRACVFTIGAFGSTAGTINENCNILVTNDIYTGYSSIGVFDSCYFGAGAGTTKATHNIRVKQGGALNEVRFYGRTQAANATYFLATDGGDLTGSVDGTLYFFTAYTSTYTSINSGTYTGILSNSSTARRWTMGANLANPIQIRREGDAANRMQIDRDGGIRHLNATTGATVASIINGGTGYLISGENIVQIAAFTTAGRPAANNPLYLRRPIIDTDLGLLLWSDGTNWLSPNDSISLGHTERTVDGTQSITTGGAAQTVLWQTSSVTARGGISYAAGVFTVTKPGRYSMTAWGTLAASATGRRQWVLRRNGANRGNIINPAPATGAWAATACIVADCVAGDTLDVTCFQDSGGSLAVSGGYITVTNLGH